MCACVFEDGCLNGDLHEYWTGLDNIGHVKKTVRTKRQPATPQCQQKCAKVIDSLRFYCEST